MICLMRMGINLNIKQIQQTVSRNKIMEQLYLGVGAASLAAPLPSSDQSRKRYVRKNGKQSDIQTIINTT